jgi:hypothetical protein
MLPAIVVPRLVADAGDQDGVVNISHSMPGRRLCTRVPQEEADHLPAGVGTARVRVGAAETAAGPSMARTMQDPLLKDLPAGRVEMDCAGEWPCG